MYTMKLGYSFQSLTQLINKGRNGRRKLANNTYASINRYTGLIDIKLHGHSIIVVCPDNSFVVSNCGWATKTTKDRINQFTTLGVYQRKHVWYVSNGDEFVNNTVFNKPESELTQTEIDRLLAFETFQEGRFS